MKLLLLPLLLAAAPALAQTQPSYYALRGQSQAAYDAKRYREAGQLFDQAAGLPKAQPTGSDYYNAACDWALAGDPTKAFAYLDKAMAAGWDNIAHVQEDSDLSSLHADSRWLPLLAHMRAAVAQAEAHQNLPLKHELEEIRRRDQRARLKAAALFHSLGPHAPGLDTLSRAMAHADSLNLPRVTAMLDKYGWPGKTLVGREGSSTAFLVIQHSNLPTMLKYLPLMRAAAAKGELDKRDLALTEDRVLTDQGKPQLYGSQYHRNPTSGQMEFFPIADEAHVDERRATMNLEPLSKYAKGAGIAYPAAGR